MKKIQLFIGALLVLAFGAFALVPSTTVGAAALDVACEGNDDSAVCANKDASSDTFINDLINVLLFIIGGISVLMIIIGGILYVTSQGDSGNVTKAKNTILYAIVGLIVSLLAYAIVKWVFDQF